MSEMVSMDQLPVLGDEFMTDGKKHLKLTEVLGEGGYGCVFRAEQTDSSGGLKTVAVKVEKYSKSMLHIEVSVLKTAQKVSSIKHLCEMYEFGSKKPNYVYLVMSLLGRDLHRLRNDMPDRKFTFSTAVRLGMQTLQACEDLHSIGFISRDIKPGNFAPGLRVNKQNKLIFMYDFGLARRFLDKNGNHLPTRREVGWRGTTRYGSLNAHLRMDLSRRDDIESWFYQLVELTRGTLPWRMITDRAAVHNAKKHARVAGRCQFLLECPPCYDEILTRIDALAFEDKPPYAEFQKLLETLCTTKDVSSYHWDWEDEPISTSTISQSSISEKENLVAGHEEAKGERTILIKDSVTPLDKNSPKREGTNG